MTRFSIARRGAALTVLATLISVPAVVAAATPASAAACTGVVTNHANSRFNSIVGYYYRAGGNDIAKPGRGGSGTVSNPITRFSTPSDRAAKVEYRDLRNNDYVVIATHHLEWGGIFAIDPCHWATVTVF